MFRVAPATACVGARRLLAVPWHGVAASLPSAPRFVSAGRPMVPTLRSPPPSSPLAATVRHTVFFFLDAAKASAARLLALQEAYAALAQTEGIREGLVAYRVGPDLKLSP
eukprot:EG_transcript_58502